MKRIFIFLVIILCSCVKNTKKDALNAPDTQNNRASSTVTNTTSVLTKTKNSNLKESLPEQNFEEAFRNLPLKSVPFVDKTNFDSFIDPDDINPINPKALKLPMIYKDWYEDDYYYRAISGYRLNVSNNYYTAVITIQKGNNEMESILINYDVEGTIIASKVVAYDEIAEGWSRIVSRIGQSFLRVDTIFWSEVKEVTQSNYQFNDDGTIEALNTEKLHETIDNYSLVNSLLIDLKLEWAQIELGYLLVEELSQVTSETLVVIPVIAEEYKDLLRLDSHMLLVNPHTGIVSHSLFESYKANGWQSDAIAIEDITLDPLVYRIENASKAFGIRIIYRNGSKPNPYQEEVISLYTKDGNRLKKVLDNFTINKSIGEVNVNRCYASFEKTQNEIFLDTIKANGYYNLLVESLTSSIIYEEDENGDCQPRVTNKAVQKKVLRYGSNQYEEAGISNKVKATKTLEYSEVVPSRLTNLQIDNFYLEHAYQIANTKIVCGNYDSGIAGVKSQDTENDWGDRLLQLDNTNHIVYQSIGVGDPYVYEPHFYTSNDSNKTIIICQLAFEYPFGGEVFMLENDTIKYIGTIDIESTEEDNYLTDMVVIKGTDQRIEFSFKSDTLILEPGTNDIIIPNNNVMYVYENDTLFLRK